VNKNKSALQDGKDREHATNGSWTGKVMIMMTLSLGAHDDETLPGSSWWWAFRSRMG